MKNEQFRETKFDRFGHPYFRVESNRIGMLGCNPMHIYLGGNLTETWRLSPLNKDS